jgi:hypothetical protein
MGWWRCWLRPSLLRERQGEIDVAVEDRDKRVAKAVRSAEAAKRRLSRAEILLRAAGDARRLFSDEEDERGKSPPGRGAG